MITESKFQHIIGVARLCYKLAKEKYHANEEFARSMWAIGFNHDIGYEFINDGDSTKEHPIIADNIIQHAFYGNCHAIEYHGKRVAQDDLQLRILNEADLQIDATGKLVTVEERLEDIRNRYGDNSDQYEQAYCLALELGLIDFCSD